MRALSKSKIMEGFQCHRKLYFSLYRKELKPPAGLAQQAIFDTGNEVGVFDRNIFPEGHLIDCDYYDLDKAMLDTNEAIKNGKNTIYEAAFGNENLYCAIDILHRSSSDQPWGVYEVKSGTSAKDVYIKDVAVQCFILNELGISWDKVHVVFINNKVTHPNLDDLFCVEDVTDQVLALQEEITNDVKLLHQISEERDPETPIGRHCDKPYECDYKEVCWKSIPEKTVFNLNNSWKLFDKGYLDLDSINTNILSAMQLRAYNAIINNEIFVDKIGLKSDLEKIAFPIYHLDFETVAFAIPKYEGTRPYQQIPFQFSVHLQKSFDDKLPKHFEFLHKEDSDPRRKLAEAIVDSIPASAQTVMAFNSGFESRVIKDLAKAFPDLKSALLAISDKLSDPHPIIKKNVYHPDFNGSFSLKSVAPALIGEEESYDTLEVANGQVAQAQYAKMISGSLTSEESQKIESDLLKYCEQDTLVMVKIVRSLYVRLAE